MTNNSVKPKGFTLIETLIAVLLLTLAVGGPLTIASKGLTSTRMAKDQFVAFYLAQDAVEYVRYLRDTACLNSYVSSGSTDCADNVWLSNLTTCVSLDGSTKCYFDSLASEPASPTICTAGVCPTMLFDSTRGKYNYVSGSISDARFVRTISIKRTPSDADEALLTVTVEWSNTPGALRVPITVQETLFRWQ